MSFSLISSLQTGQIQVQNVAQKAAPWNSSKKRNLLVLHWKWRILRFLWPRAKSLTDQCPFKALKVDHFQRSMSWLNKYSRFLDLINQSVECYFGTFPIPPGSFQPWSWCCRTRQRNSTTQRDVFGYTMGNSIARLVVSLNFVAWCDSFRIMVIAENRKSIVLG